MLKSFLLDLSRRPFAWGQDDCCLILADWWQANHGEDAASQLRGQYDDEAGCRALVRREGGLLRLVSRLARSVGAKPAKDPQGGDFGIVRHRGRHLGAIRADARLWAGKSPSGLQLFEPERVVRAWSITKGI